MNDPNDWIGNTYVGAQEDARVDLETLISTGELGCLNAKRDRDESMGGMIGTWAIVDHVATCPPDALCHQVAELCAAGRIIEACRLAAEVRPGIKKCEVWPLMRRHLAETGRAYLDAVVAELAARPPDGRGFLGEGFASREIPYASLCWRTLNDGDDYWEFDTDAVAVSVTVQEMHPRGGGQAMALVLDGRVELGGTKPPKELRERGVAPRPALWYAEWSPIDGWTFGYLWAGLQWPQVRLTADMTPVVPAPREVAEALATFAQIEPFQSPDMDFWGWQGNIHTDQEAAEMVEHIRSVLTGWKAPSTEGMYLPE